MTSAEIVAAPETPPTPVQQILQRINDLSQRQKLAAAAAIALAVAMVVGVLLWSRPAEYAVLFANLDERDGGAIVTSLQQQNVPYRFTPGGGAILVPSERVHDVRLRLAAQGLPKGGLVGFELMENQKLGVSQFLEQVNFQRALEGELARTIQSIASVSSARVHLAIPKQTGFLRDEQKPTASVMVTLYPGRSMEPAQVAGVVHLVSSSVPHLANERVSVVDQNGNLLTGSPDPLRNAGLDPTQLKYVRELEAGYIRRIETILKPIVGTDNFRAQVTADVDFNQVEETAESYRPNPTNNQAIRSQQTSSQMTRDMGPQGVPGALTNQPPVPAIAPITDPAVPGTPGADGVPVNSSQAATTNYELDRTIQHVRQSLGQIRRLSVAVVVNHRKTTLANGETQAVPLSDEEVAQINALVREAMGFSQARGDSLNVSSAPFAPDTGEQEFPLWKDPEMLALATELFKYLALLAALAFVYFGVIRPLIRTVAPPPPAPEPEPAVEALEGADDDEDAIVTLEDAPRIDTFEDKLARVKELARNNPKLLANVLRDWMGANEENKK